MKVAILYGRVFEHDGTRLTLGGIQTYIWHLARLTIEMGWETRIFQLGIRDFERTVQKVRIFAKSGIPLTSSPSKAGSFLAAHAQKWFGSENGVLIFATDSLFCETKAKSISVQHGVTWDLPEIGDNKTPKILMGIIPTGIHQIARESIEALRASRANEVRRALLGDSYGKWKRRKAMQYMVCVDYNYLNVTKADGRPDCARIWVIPNCAIIGKQKNIAGKKTDRNAVKILFARRLVWYRGTRLIAPVFKRLLATIPQTVITFAGEGPDEPWLRAYFQGEARVKFIRYRPQNASQVFTKYDIAVVPSLGSEGTSLAVLEAMANGCVVLATSVGGNTNILIDGYNGNLVAPNEEDLYRALYRLVMSPTLRAKLSKRAFAVVKNCFDLPLWKAKWQEVLLTVSQT